MAKTKASRVNGARLDNTQPVTITVYDDRPEFVERMRHIATFKNVPDAWDAKRILAEYGIAEHLHVTRSYGNGKPEIIQHGRR